MKKKKRALNTTTYHVDKYMCKAQREADKFIFEHWGGRVCEASSWCVGRMNSSSSSSSSSAIGDMPAWMSEWSSSLKGSLALVVLLDQLSRHMKRELLLVKDKMTTSVDTLACSWMARSEIISKWKGHHISTGGAQEEESTESGMMITDDDSEQLYDCGVLNSSELVFLLMPFRHDINAATLVHNLEELDRRKQQLKMVLFFFCK
jgi:hypothetical protein